MAPSAVLRTVGGDLIERRGRLFKARGLLFGPPREIVGRGLNFRRAPLNGDGASADRPHRLLQRLDGIVAIRPQLFELRDDRLFDLLVEIAIGQTFERRAKFVDRMDPVGNVGCEFDDLRHLAIQIEDRIVGGLNPDLLIGLSEPLEFGSDEFAAAELRPEFPVVGGLRIGRIDEHAVMAPLDFVEVISEQVEKIVIRLDDAAIDREFDDALRPRNGIELSGIFGAPQLLGRDVGRDFDDLRHFALARQDRVVGGLNPDFPAAFSKPLIFSRLEFALPQLGPKFLIGGAARIFGFDEQAVMLAGDLAEIIAKRVAEILIGGEDLSIRIEFDDRQRFAYGCQDGFGVDARIEHF